MTETIAISVSLLGILVSLVIFIIGRYLERRRVNKALLSEISRLLVVLVKYRKFWDNCVTDSKTAIPLIPFSTPIYDKYVERIGMIDSKIVAEVAAFYGYLHFINSLQKTQQEYALLNKRNEFDKMYKDSLSTICNDYRSTFDEAFIKSKLTRTTPFGNRL